MSFDGSTARCLRDGGCVPNRQRFDRLVSDEYDATGSGEKVMEFHDFFANQNGVLPADPHVCNIAFSAQYDSAPPLAKQG